ncbi:MAG: FkbM family methyltransferase [Chitinophagaceae bacterium]|nr:FkbM family methyltransferase [Chitinophagaceae bacterium]
MTSGLQYIDYEEIVCETMDDYCKINKIEHIHLVKIDVERQEIKVLNGGINMTEITN